MSKKPFIATIEIQIAILAETETEAQESAFKHFRDEHLTSRDVRIQPMTYCPDGWEIDNILYSTGNEEISVRDALAMQKPPRDETDRTASEINGC